MNPMRDTVKEHFPSVLLTLLSIVQALALDLLWSHIRVSEHLFVLNQIGVQSWIQVAATFLGVILIWVVYANSVMQFRWVPSMSDMVFPFIIGLLEFMLIETLGPDMLPFWFVIFAAVFAMMYTASHLIMRNARRDRDNVLFFQSKARAGIRDFMLGIITCGGLCLISLLILFVGPSLLLTIPAVTATAAALLWQFRVTAQFWKDSTAENEAPA